MTRRFRIPLVADVVTTSDAGHIRALAGDSRLDRVPPEGPWLNRLIAGRIRRLLSLRGKPFPTMLARGDVARAQAQQALAERLSHAALGVAGTPDEVLEPVVAFVRGTGTRDAASIALQSAAGRLFNPAYSADSASWRAARVFDSAVSSRNPLSWIISALAGRARRARALLGARLADDTVGIHATGIAVHNMVVTAERMRALFAGGAARSALDAAAAANAAFAGPRAIVRQVVRPADTVAGGLNTGTLVTLMLRDAADARMDTALALMEGEWSACPAGAWLRALYEEVWTRACRRDDQA